MVSYICTGKCPSFFEAHVFEQKETTSRKCVRYSGTGKTLNEAMSKAFDVNAVAHYHSGGAKSNFHMFAETIQL